MGEWLEKPDRQTLASREEKKKEIGKVEKVDQKKNIENDKKTESLQPLSLLFQRAVTVM